MIKSIATNYITAVAFQLLVFPLFDIDVSLWVNCQIALIVVAVSRLKNWIHNNIGYRKVVE